MNDTSFKTSLMEKIAYGMGDTACNVVFAITSSLIVYFYTNVIGMSAALVGTILLASRVFDGISDLLIAQIVDKVNSPKGKARAWILWMAAPYGIASVLMFCVPPHSSTMVQAIYVFITYNLCTTGVYTALNLPYSNLAPMMTRNDDDLAKLNLFRMAMSPIGNLIVTALTLPFINMLGGGVAGWLVGQLMEVSGFTGLEVEIPSAISMVKNLYIYGNMIAWALVIILMLVYHLDKEYDGIMKDLTGRTA